MERFQREQGGHDSAVSRSAAQERSAQNSAQGDFSSYINNSPYMVAQRKKLQILFGPAVQLQEVVDEKDETLQGGFGAAQRVEEDKEPLQGKFEIVQRLEDEEELLQGRLETAERIEDEEEPLQGTFATVQRVEDEKEPLEGKFQPVQRVDDEEVSQLKLETGSPAQLQPAPAPKSHNTGLSDNLKAGIEPLSGISLDNVKVHQNSSQPARLNALGYAQGTDIHVAPGQEQHLPHEAWHVVQPQGRGKPTMQLNDGVPVNDDKGQESEADAMSARGIALGQSMEGNRRGEGLVDLGTEVTQRTQQLASAIPDIINRSVASTQREMLNRSNNNDSIQLKETVVLQRITEEEHRKLYESCSSGSGYLGLRFQRGKGLPTDEIKGDQYGLQDERYQPNKVNAEKYTLHLNDTIKLAVGESGGWFVSDNQLTLGQTFDKVRDLGQLAIMDSPIACWRKDYKTNFASVGKRSIKPEDFRLRIPLINAWDYDKFKSRLDEKWDKSWWDQIWPYIVGGITKRVADAITLTVGGKLSNYTLGPDLDPEPHAFLKELDQLEEHCV